MAISDSSGHRCTETPCPICRQNIAARTTVKTGSGKVKVQTRGKKQGK